MPEKITINLEPVDLGRIDVLVDQGLYANRTDLIRTAIRNQLAGHEQIIDDVTVKQSFAVCDAPRPKRAGTASCRR